MSKFRLPYLQKELTRHGKTIWYVRIDRGQRFRIKSKYGTNEFKTEYNAILSGQQSHSKTIKKNSVKWLVGRYRQSGKWELSSKATKKQRDNFFHALVESSGNVPYVAIKKHHIVEAIDRRKKTPAAANNYLKTLKALFKWAYESGYLIENPAESVKKLKYKSLGFTSWTSEDLDKFRKKWKIGSRERLAMEVPVDRASARGCRKAWKAAY